MIRDKNHSSVTAFAVGHFFVDFACGFSMYRMYSEGELEELPVTAVFLLYNMLAFALQFIFGAVSDVLRDNGSRTAAVGLLVTAAGVAVGYRSPWLCTVLLGLGNACFHVGGGIDALTRSRGMTRAGIFVSAGAVGLAAGIHYGEGDLIPGWIVIAALIACAVFAASLCTCKRGVLPAYEFDGDEKTRRKRPITGDVLAITMLIAAVFIRSWAGFAAPHPESDSKFAWLLPAFAAFAGKFAGGILADLLGARRVGTAAVVLSAPLFFLGAGHYILFLAAVFLFNIAMPVTLCELAVRFPEYEGFAFGLTALAIFIGYLVNALLPIEAPAAKILVPVTAVIAAVWIFLSAADRKAE